MTSRPADVTTPTVPRAVAAADGDDDVVLGPGPAAAGCLVGGGAGQQAGRRQEHEARVVGHLERHRRRDRLPGRLEQHRASRRAVLLGDLGELVADGLAQQLRVVEDRGQLLDGALELGLLVVELELARTW